MNIKRIQIIINPASGRPRPVLRMLNAAYHNSGIDWNVDVTQGPGDARRLTKSAMNKEVDAIGVYGGDGTVREVASGLINTDVPMMILPGGTANVMSVELGVPFNIIHAARLILNDRGMIRPTDMGQIDDEFFLLRLSAGFEAEVVKATGRRLKSNVGMLAYALSGFEALLRTRPTHYSLILDGHKKECKGLSYVVANSGNLGIPGVTLSPKINVADGLLDVIVIRSADLKSLFDLDIDFEHEDIISEFFLHWQAKEVSIQATAAQSIQCDGEVWGEGPVNAKVIPQAVNIIVPRK